jgi:acid stress-induced BolA-like protein IbaG/YrbA
MTLDGEDLLYNYELRLMSVEGHLDMPRRKQIVKRAYFDTDDVYEAAIVTVRLFGMYETVEDLRMVTDAIRDLMTDNATHTVTISEHSLAPFYAVARNGATIEIYGRYAVVITIPFTITEL